MVKEKIFTDKSENAVRDYISELKSQNKQSIKICDVLEKFFTKEIHLKGITYRNWQAFQQGKEIEKAIFIAFCEALEIKDWRCLVNRESIYWKDYSLFENLRLFDHQEQVNSLILNLAPNQPKVFLAANQCQYSRTWMLRRLEAEISHTIELNCKLVSLTGSRFCSRGIGELKARFNEKYLNLLNKEHIILILDIDDYDLQSVEQLIVEFWYPLFSKVPQNTQGKLLMFLLATTLKNDWQEKLQKSSTLSGQITPLSSANPFRAEDIAVVLSKIALKRQKPLSEPNKLACQLIKNSQGKTEKLLQEIYQYFECRTTEFSIWQRYP